MSRWLLAFAALAALASTTAKKEIVGYYSSWASYRNGNGKCDISDLPAELYTCLIYAFVGITPQGDVRVMDPWLDLPDNYGLNGFGKFNKLREKNPNLKTLIAMGGWNEDPAVFSAVVGNPSLRTKSVNKISDFLKKYNFDGIDLDWEYPCQRGGKPDDRKNFILWVKELKNKIKNENKIVTAAVGAGEDSAAISYDIPELCKHLDRVHLMTYDLHGSWENTAGHNAPLYSRKSESGNDLKFNVDACVRYWLKKGCPPEKLILGVPFYGRSFTLTDKNKYSLGAPTRGPGRAGPYTQGEGLMGYNEICESWLKNKNSTGVIVKRDKEHCVPYAVKGDQWIGYDDPTSLKEKCDYIKSHNLGGVMVWSVDTDDFKGLCVKKNYLANTLKDNLKN